MSGFAEVDGGTGPQGGEGVDSLLEPLLGIEDHLGRVGEVLESLRAVWDGHFGPVDGIEGLLEQLRDLFAFE